MKMKSTKKALLMSALSLLLCCSMLIGTTFAWFTDEVTSGNNIIKAGNLDVELEYAKVENGQVAGWDTVAGKTEIFNPNALWEPGHMEIVYLRVSNLGTLELKYQLGVNVAGERPGITMDENGQDKAFNLSDYLVSKVVEIEENKVGTFTRENAIEADDELGLKDYNGETKALDPKGGENDMDYVALIVYMPTTVGNEANHKTGTDAPMINLGINLFATQKDAESDSFGPEYDEDAWHPEMQVLNEQDLQAAINNGETNIKLMDDIELTGPIVIPAPVTGRSASVEPTPIVIDLNGNEITSKQTSGIAIEIRGAAEIKNGKISTTNGVAGLRATGKSASLTLTDMTVSVTGTGSNAEWNHAAIGAAGGATVVINNGTYSAEVGYGLITKTSGADITINDGTFTTKGTTNSAAVRFDSGWDNSKIYTKAIINGGEFNAPEGGFAFIASNAYGKDITLNGGIFNGELDSSYQDNGVVINGGTFKKTIFQGGSHQDKYLINGGTFAENVSAKVAEGFKAVANTDGTYSVIFPQESFDNLIENAGENATIEIPAGEYTFPASDLKAGQTLNCAPGTVFEGKSGMDIKGATVIGATFSNPDGVAGTGTINGTFKDCVFEGSEVLRWCYSKAGETVLFENCVFKTDFRGVHFDDLKGNVIFRNCEINGFNAMGGDGTVTFEGCTFGCDESRYNGLNMHMNTKLIDCKFNFLSGKINFIDFEEPGKTLLIQNCTATLDGAAVNVLEFVGGTYKDQTTITVREVTTTDDGMELVKDCQTGKVALGGVDEYVGDSLNVPESVTSLGNSVFGGSDIKTVTVHASVNNFGASGVSDTNASGGAFKGSNVETVILNEGMKEIPAAAFNGATKLTSVNIPSTVEKIGVNAFRSTALTELVIPATVKEIACGAFRDMDSLTTVTIEGNAVTLPGYVFRDCSNLRTVYLNVDTLTLNGSMNFANASSNNPNTNNITFHVKNVAVAEAVKAHMGVGSYVAIYVNGALYAEIN